MPETPLTQDQLLAFMRKQNPGVNDQVLTEALKGSGHLDAAGNPTESASRMMKAASVPIPPTLDEALKSGYRQVPDNIPKTLDEALKAGYKRVGNQPQSRSFKPAAKPAPYQSPVYPGGPESRTATQVMEDQAANVLTGIPQAITGIPSALGNIGLAAVEQMTGGRIGAGSTKSLMEGSVAPIAPYITKAQTGSFPQPESPEWQQNAQAAGGMLGGAALGAAAEVPQIRNIVGKVTKPIATKVQSTVAAVKKPFAPIPGTPATPAIPEVPGVLDAPMVNKWMDVPAKEVIHGANPGQRLLNEKLIGATKTATKTNVDSALTKAGNDLAKKLSDGTKNGIRIDAESLTTDALDSTVKKLGAPKDSTFKAQIEGLKKDILERYPNLDDLNPEEAHALKVELGDAISWKGLNYDNPINQALIKIYRGINGEIKSGVPGIELTQRRWGDLYIASRNLTESIAEDVVGKGSGPAPPTPPPISKAVPGKPATPPTPSRATINAKKALKYGLWMTGTGLTARILRDVAAPATHIP